ncbi:hypothetical protein GCM10018779_51890 [Streptomyces griseocarneus]|nr:hypothetical protein GCM10018779_51890 [Streptomyces griseocarneus]
MLPADQYVPGGGIEEHPAGEVRLPVLGRGGEVCELLFGRPIVAEYVVRAVDDVRRIRLEQEQEQGQEQDGRHLGSERLGLGCLSCGRVTSQPGTSPQHPEQPTQTRPVKQQ